MKQHFLYSEGGGSAPVITPIKWKTEPDFLIVDLFCGAGGTTTGFERAMLNGISIAKVIACVNHDPIAIKSHWKNHPEVVHFEEDIRTLDLGPLKALVEAYRILYPNAKIILWASLECTNFSKAKGGQPRNADSRTLADHLERYVTALSPDYIQIENVVEFRSWGPLRISMKKLHKGNSAKNIYPNCELKIGKNKITDENEYLWVPESKKNGKDFIRWCDHIKSFGYREDWRELNSADFGAYTSRNRLFGCFAKDDLPIAWPEATHSKKPVIGDLFDKPLLKWMPVKDVLDFKDEGQSIFGRKKPLSDKTLERIYAGLVKYVAGGKDAFMVKWNSMSATGKYMPPNTDDPCPVISTQNRLGMCFIAKYYSGKPEGKVIPVTGPAGTIKTSDGQSLVQAIPFLVASNGGNPNSKVFSINNPCRTITTSDNKAIVNAAFIAKYYGNGANISSIEEPAGTLTTKDRLTKVQPVYIINPSHGGHSTSVEKPCPVIIARQDKAPLYLTNIEYFSNVDIDLQSFLGDDDLKTLDEFASGQFNKEELSVRLRILEFMLLYQIADIKMRMLKVKELKVIQGFGDNYILEGNQTDQKKFIGNSVHPIIPEKWSLSLRDRLRSLQNQN